jgi:hypothetical protein
MLWSIAIRISIFAQLRLTKWFYMKAFQHQKAQSINRYFLSV